MKFHEDGYTYVEAHVAIHARSPLVAGLVFLRAYLNLLAPEPRAPQ